MYGIKVILEMDILDEEKDWYRNRLNKLVEIAGQLEEEESK
jgi:hypothetical protein